MKQTLAGNSYWNETGAYQKEYDQLWKDLVPSSGEANTIDGELIRCAGRLLYDYCNNGNCNAVDYTTETEHYTCSCCNGRGHVYEYDEDDNEEEVICDECYGDGEIEEQVDGDKFITDYYKDMLKFLYDNLNDKKPVVELEKFMLGTLGYSSYKFEDDEMKYYNNLIDTVVYQIINK